MTATWYLDSETCGLHSMMVLFQYAKGDGDIHLYHIWKEPVRDTLKLFEEVADGTVVGFNLAFDWFHVAKIFTIWRLLPRHWIPEEHIEDIAIIEPLGMDGPCIKPRNALDLMLHSRKGPYQSLMARDDIRIRRVPTALAYALAEELEKRIQLDGIYFAKSADKDAPRWHVYDIRNREGQVIPDFKDVCLRFNPAGGLKYLAEHALGYEPKFHFTDVEVDKKYRPKEFGYAPFALAVSTPDEQWAVYKKNSKGEQEIAGYAWPGVIQHHIDHWHTNKSAQEYARDDIVYTRGLAHHFGDPEPGDDDSVLACMVPVVRWRGFQLNLKGIQELHDKAKAIVENSPVNINKPSEVRRYITECMDEMESIILEESTRKANLTSVSNWKIDFEAEDDDTGAEGLQGWKISNVEECTKCFGDDPQCARCGGTGKLQPGMHPASKRAAEILHVKAAAKEVELFQKLLKAGRFHASVNVIGALSGRMSGGDGLNAQGIKHDKTVRSQFPMAWTENPTERVRNVLQSVLGDEFEEVWELNRDHFDNWVAYQLSGGDFDSFEVCIADAVYKDPGITKIITSGEKIHAYFAMCMYPGVTYEEVLASEGTEFDMYTKGKSGFFGFLYFGDWSTLVRNFGIPAEDAKNAESTFFKKYPNVKKARQRIIDWFSSMRQPGGIGTMVVWNDPRDRIETLLGFPRFFTLENQICKALFDLARKPPKHWRDVKIKVMRREGRVQSAVGAVSSALYGAAFGLQGAITRAAGNHEIQGTGAGITKATQRRVWDLQPHGVHELIVAPLNIHDEIMAPCRPEWADRVAEVVRDSVESFRPVVPLIGMTWFKKMESWAGKKGGAVEGEVKIQSPLMQQNSQAA